MRSRLPFARLSLLWQALLSLLWHGLLTVPPRLARTPGVRSGNRATTQEGSRILLVMLAGLFLALPVNAQDNSVKTVPFEGPEFFSHILHHEKLKPIRSLQDAEKDPTHSIVILFGNPRFFETDKPARQSLKRFVDNGGNLLIASDYPLFLDELDLGVAGARVSQPTPAAAYRGDDRCPLLNYEDSDVPGAALGNDHPLFQLLGKKLATNCPSYVANYKRFFPLQRLLYYPETAKADVVQFPPATIPGKAKKKDLGQPPPTLRVPIPRPLPFMVGSPRDAGPDRRVLLIAGHGMFMNGMMVQKDNDNFDFALNAVRWLRESSAGKKRSKALFVVDNEIVGNFNMNLTGGSPIPVPTVEHLNRLLRGLEEERFFQKLLSDLFGVYLGRFIAILVALATFVLLIYGAKKMLEGRVHVESAVPSMVGLLPVPNPAAPAQERSQARLRHRDYVTECRQLALEWLRLEFDVTPERWQAGMHAEFTVQGSFWGRWTLHRQTALVLRLARGPDSMRVSRHQFFLLAEALRDLTEARHEGRLALLVGGEEVGRSSAASGYAPRAEK
ncbi:MAG: hypothetical protein EXR98_21490 [Gemmataceae bacterium]|nr:hypothetical protein [Gemmataceae bacterium]